MSANSSPRKWRKSLFGFGLNWPTKSALSPSDPDSPGVQKRHNSVSFAPSTPPSPATPAEKRLRGYSTQSWRGSPPNAGHHHGSVQSLVIRQKIQRKCSMTAAGMGGTGSTILRRPSIPSLPLAIVQAVTDRLRQASSTFSLDQEDSAFCSAESACSSASLSSSPGKRNSGMSTSSAGESVLLQSPVPLMEWSEEQKLQIEGELEERCAQSIGHQFVKNYKKLAWANLASAPSSSEARASEVLCAEGNVQFHLLSMAAPPGKRVVNVGRSALPSNGWLHLSPSMRPYNPNSLKLS